MADHILESRVWLARARPEVFAFFADPSNLALVTPRSYRLRFLSLPAPMAAGRTYDIRLSWLAIPVTWRAFVREFDPPYRFVDVQVLGPWARWEHRHRFLEERGGTSVEDRVIYRLPLGALGRAAHAVLVGRQIAALWRYRDARLREIFA